MDIKKRLCKAGTKKPSANSHRQVTIMEIKDILSCDFICGDCLDVEKKGNILYCPHIKKKVNYEFVHKDCPYLLQDSTL